MRMNLYRKLLLFISLGLLFSGCGQDYLRTQDVQIIDVKKAKEADISFRALKADLIVRGGSGHLAFVQFNYFMPTSRSFTEYQEDQDTGKLLIYDKFNPSIGVYPSSDRLNLWTSILHKRFPLSVKIDLRQGHIKWDARQMNLKRLELDLGKVLGSFNLSKSWSESFYADVRLEDGKLNFLVPQSLGVRIETANENQKIFAEGFKKEGKVLTNAMYQKDKKALRFYIHPSEGQIFFKTDLTQ